MSRPTKSELVEAARLLREVIAEVESGNLPAPTPRDIAAVRRIEGAAAGLDAAAKGTS